MRDTSERHVLEERLARQIRRTSLRYDVLAPDDRVLVAVSGGKDSYGLLHLLDALAPRLPFAIEFVAFHIDQCQPGYDGAPLTRWLEQRGKPFQIVVDDTYTVVQRNIRAGQTPCSVCSRLRRGILYTWAKRLGCTKVALGHHRDDAVATLLMNLFYCGKIQSMPARYRTKDGRLDVIRPLIEVAERDLARLAELAGFPILPCNLCARQEDHQRTRMGRIIDALERGHPRVRNVMLAALKNVWPSHLLDKSLRKVDEDTPSDVC